MSIADKDPALKAIHVSIGFDKRLWREDVAGSRAHVTMLGKQGILNDEDVATILQGLALVERELKEGRFPFRDEDEDIHLNIERRLTELIGPTAGKLHTGRSRNDQVATDLRVWVVWQASSVGEALMRLGQALLRAARRELEVGTVLPFYTHLQRAQPVLLAHHLLAHTEALERDRGRVQDAVGRASESPLGAGAGSGSGFPVDPWESARLLGLRGACRNSLDAVAARDFACELLAALAILMTHLSRLAEEMILWSSQEFGFVRLSDKVTTGSSIMPQKRNPDGAELVRGKAGRVLGDLVTLLTATRALPLAYNKDLQEDKEALFDGVDTTLLSLNVLTATVEEATFDRARMREAATARAGYANATELADYLALKGMPFREAHGVVRRLVEEARTRGVRLEEFSLEYLKQAAPLIDGDVFEALSVEAALTRRSAFGGTAPERVRESLEAAERRWHVPKG